MASETVWTVQDYNRVAERKRKVVERKQRQAEKWGRKIIFFDTEREALHFMRVRAEEECWRLADQLNAAEKRLDRCRKKITEHDERASLERVTHE